MALLLMMGLQQAWAAKPVLLYSRYFNAPGENRYLPDGQYKEILNLLREEYEVRVDAVAPTPESLSGVDVVLVANPSAEAVAGQKDPGRFTPETIEAIRKYVQRGGGWVMMGNQENHNLDTAAANRLLESFGIQWVEEHTDMKAISIPASHPVLGGLTWAYYTGNHNKLLADHPARPNCWIANQASIPLAGGKRNPDGACLLAVSTPGRGRVVSVSDSGWLIGSVLEGQGIAGVAIKDHDNVEILRRLLAWARGSSDRLRWDRYLPASGKGNGVPKVEPPKGGTALENEVFARRKEGELALDAYLPAGKGPFPGVLLVHGGGWTSGNRQSFRPLAKWFANQGYVAVTSSYRLAGTARFPAAVEDCKTAIRWMRKNAARLRLDPARIGGVGGSAGGHLIGMVATTSHLQLLDHPEDDLSISCSLTGAVLMGAGVDQVARSLESPSPIQNCVMFFGGSLAEVPEMYQQGSPITHLSKSTPPLMFLEGELDNAGVRYVKMRGLMDSIGLHHEMSVVAGGKHGCWGREPWFSPMASEMLRFLQSVDPK